MELLAAFTLVAPSLILAVCVLCAIVCPIIALVEEHQHRKEEKSRRSASDALYAEKAAFRKAWAKRVYG